MSEIQVRNKLSAPHMGSESQLYKLISAKANLESAQRLAYNGRYAELWNAGWWGFSRSHTFNSLSAENQKRVLSVCNEGLLSEAYFIEKSGLSYCAKMILSAESTDVAQLYSLIGADEAKHLAWIEPYIKPEQKQKPAGYFLEFLSRLIEDCSPELLVYLVQIILEGWGLSHYQRLSASCSDRLLSDIFTRILKDEALHHKSGDMLFDARKLSAAEIDFAEESLRTYTLMVRVGPQSALTAIDNVSNGSTSDNGLTSDQLIDVLNALNHYSETQRKLDLLKSLMLQPGLEESVEKLERSGSFLPYSVEEAAEFYQSNH